MEQQIWPLKSAKAEGEMKQPFAKVSVYGKEMQSFPSGRILSCVAFLERWDYDKFAVEKRLQGPLLSLLYM